jgi:hypothetical protein
VTRDTFVTCATSLVNVTAGYRFARVRAAIGLINTLNATHPVEPRQVRVGITLGR